MKVNVHGKGVIPGVKQLLPAYNIELDKETIYRILGSDKIAVFKADGCIRITRKNIDEIFTPQALKTIPKPLTVPAPAPKSVVKKKAPKKEVVKEEVVEEPTTFTPDVVVTETDFTPAPEIKEIEVLAVDTLEEEVPHEDVDTIDSSDEETTETVETTETIETVEEAVEEVVEEKPRHKKKNKKNRNNQ